ncbi:MAG: hypothetical protein P4L99_05475 [Chthoniobacter sp.]|nr:hypothetical protein [Chthoniobacter sp.]
MGRARNQDLAGYYLRAAGVAAVWIDADGCIGAQDVAPLALDEPQRIAYCCDRRAHFILAYRLQMWLQDQPATPSQASIAAKLEELAELGGVGLTPHAVAAERAAAAVATIDKNFEAAAVRGELRELNAAFKAARAVDPSLRYADFVAAKKASLIEALAAGKMPAAPALAAAAS